MTKKQFGQRIQAFRKRLEMSQGELAARAGVDIRSIQRIEADGNPTFETLMAIASALNSNPAEILDSEGGPPGSDALFDVSDLLLRVGNLTPVLRATVLYIIYKDKRILEDLRIHLSATQLQGVQDLLRAL